MESFHYERGLVQFVEHLNRTTDALHGDVIHFNQDVELEGATPDDKQVVGVEIAMQYTGEFTENIHSYVNNINTIEGGTHLTGFRTSLTRTLNIYGKKANFFKDLIPTGDDFREGLTAVDLHAGSRASVRRSD